MSETFTGHIIGGPVDPDYDGAILTADLAVSDTVLHVDDTADFDEDAAERDARVIIGLEFDTSGDLDTATGAPLAYTTADDEAGTVTLAAPSTVTASSGDFVYLEDPVSGYPVGRLEVMVAMDDGDTTGDALSAFLDVALLESVGGVELDGLAVELEEDEDGQLLVKAFPGLIQRQGAVKAMQDETVAAGAGGMVTLNLSYIPILNSEHLYIGGVYQRGSEWSRDAWTVTIPDTESRLKLGNKVAMEYLYTDPATAAVETFSAPTWHGRSGIFGNPTSPITSVGLHVDTEVGDLLIAVSIGNAFTEISDPRLSTIFTDGARTFAIGYATDLSDVVCNVMGIPDPYSQFSGIEVYSVRGDGPFAYDPARVVVHQPITSGGAVGSVGGTGHGVIAVLAAAYGTPVTLDWAGLMPNYTDWSGDGDTSVVCNAGYCATEPPPAQTNPTNTAAAVVLIGLK